MEDIIDHLNVTPQYMSLDGLLCYFNV